MHRSRSERGPVSMYGVRHTPDYTVIRLLELEIYGRILTPEATTLNDIIRESYDDYLSCYSKG
jgi:hypothetical protein